MASPSKKARASAHSAALRHKPRPHPRVQGEDDLVALVNAEGIVAYISPAIVSLLGYPPEACVGAPLSALAHPADRAAIQQMVQDVGRDPNKSLQAVYRLRAADGSARRVEGSATNLLQAPGVGAIIIQVHETARRKLAPRANFREMQTAEHFVQFYETDAFLLHALNDFAETALRSGESCIIVATQPHREALEARLRANGLNLAAAQTRGAYAALDASAMLAQFMVDDMPTPARFNAALAPLIARAARGQHHVRVFGEMVALLCAAGNQTAAIRLEELWNDLAHSATPFSLFCAYPMPHLAGQENEEAFDAICQQHTRVIPAESYTALPRLDERLRAISALQQKANSLQAEIAERQAAEHRAFEAMEETTRQMEAFVSIVSHELRTPITALKTSIQLARRRITQESISGDARGSHAISPAGLLERTEVQVRRLTRLIDDLVDLARIRSGKIEMRETLYDLGQVTSELVENERLAHPNRLIHFEGPNEPLLVRGDPDRLGQVVLNYLANALKYAPPTRPITVRVCQIDARVQVSVKDQGPGIPPEEQERIWEMFHRAPGIPVQSGSVIGLGLGLHISKMMIERQGGQVGVESAVGQGSVFWFTLPLAAN